MHIDHFELVEHYMPCLDRTSWCIYRNGELRGMWATWELAFGMVLQYCDVPVAD